MDSVIERLFPALVLFSALGSGLMAGVFFAFSAFVMTALARLPAPQGIAAMQAINVAVLNPLFLSAFLGTAAACVLVVIFSLMHWHDPGAVYLLVGSALYLVGTFMVTIVLNVPMDEALAGVVPAGPEAAGRWTQYVADWTTWNHVRAAAALAAAASLTIALWHARGAAAA